MICPTCGDKVHQVCYELPSGTWEAETRCQHYRCVAVGETPGKAKAKSRVKFNMYGYDRKRALALCRKQAPEPVQLELF